MFRNVVVGSSGVGKSPDEWPKLGETSGKRKPVKFSPRSNANPPASHGRREPKPAPAESARRPKPESPPVIQALDSASFPALGNAAPNKPQKAPTPPAKDTHVEPARKLRKKKIKTSTPLQIDICEIIQASALKKKQKSEISALKRSVKTKRKVLTGNLLDADQPKRHKGKVRPWKPRDLTKTKKIISASRKIRLPRVNFTQGMLRFKESLGLALKKGDVDVAQLANDLNGIALDGGNGEERADAIATRVAKNLIHTKKFRSYCNNIVTQELKKHASELIVMLRKFQDRMHAKDEVKAHAKRRYVCGFNESSKFLLADRVKLLIVATNLEMEEGLPSISILKRLTDAADKRNVPIVYGGLAQNIGYWTLKKAKISVLAVMNYEGANEAHSNLIKSWIYAKEEYEKLLRKIVELYLSKSSCAISQEAVQKEVEEEIKEAILNKLKE